MRIERFLKHIFLVKLFFCTMMAIASDIPDEADENPITSIPHDILFNILDKMSEKDQRAISLTCKTWSEARSQRIKGYIEQATFKDNWHPQEKELSALPFLLVQRLIRTQLEKDKYLALSQQSSLKKYLDDAFRLITFDDYTSDIESTSILFRAVFGSQMNKRFFIGHIHKLQAALSYVDVFTTHPEPKEGFRNFAVSSFPHVARYILEQTNGCPYVCFDGYVLKDGQICEYEEEDLAPFSLKPHTFVMTSDILRSEEHMRELNKILQTHAEHRVLISISKHDISHISALRLKLAPIERNLKNLIITDPQGYVKAFKRYFLSGCRSLVNLDCISFRNLKQVSQPLLAHLKHLNEQENIKFQKFLQSLGLSWTPGQDQFRYGSDVIFVGEYDGLQDVSHLKALMNLP